MTGSRLGLLLAISLILAACIPGIGTQRRGEPGGTLRIAVLSLPRVLHPYPEAQQYTSALVLEGTLLWTGLIDIDFDTIEFTTNPGYSLARDLPTISGDGRTYTFTLREGIHWSDGRPITTGDFQFAWDNAIKEENNYVGLDTLERIESFRVLDDQRIEVRLKTPLARFLALSTVAIGPVPRHVWEGKPWLDPGGNPEVVRPTVVSGPYLPRELSAERHVFARNPNFWGKQANIEQIEFVNAAPPTVLELLKTRQVEWAYNFPPAQYQEAKGIGHANLVEWEPVAGLYRLVEFNTRRPALADKRVREALVRAINRRDLIQFEDDLAVPQHGMFPQTNTRWLNPNLERYDFDLGRARQLLQQAGMRVDGTTLRDAQGQPVRLEIVWPTSSQPRGKMATYMQQQWRELGIETQVTGLEFNAFVDKVQRQKDFDVAMGSFGGGIDPDAIKSQVRTDGRQNVTGYSNRRVDELLERGAEELDDNRRKQIYDEIQTLVINDLPVFYLITLKSFTSMDRKVQGVSPRKGDSLLSENNMQFLDWTIAE